MAVQLNHTIVGARDKHESATFLTEILGLPAPVPFGHFLVVNVDNGVSLDFDDVGAERRGRPAALRLLDQRGRLRRRATPG